MAIIWCGGEDIDFPNGIPPLNHTMPLYRRADYSRCALHGGNYSISNPFANFTEGWMSFYVFPVSYQALCAGLCNASGQDAIAMGIGSNWTFQLRRRVAGTWSTLGSSTNNSINGESGNKIDFYLKYDETGIFRGYVNGNLVLEYTGDLRISGITAFNNTFLVGHSNGVRMSEFIVADEDTRLLSLKTLAPDAAGDVSDWNGAYTTIDETTNSDADLVYTDQFDKDFMCNLTGMPTGDFICKGVKIAARVADGIGGIGVQLGIKTNATVDVSATHELEGAFETIEQLYQQNPITSNRFTPAEVEALQAALRSKEVVV